MMTVIQQMVFDTSFHKIGNGFRWVFKVDTLFSTFVPVGQPNITFYLLWTEFTGIMLLPSLHELFFCQIMVTCQFSHVVYNSINVLFCPLMKMLLHLIGVLNFVYCIFHDIKNSFQDKNHENADYA